MRFCRSWQIYADDVTIRTGRVVGGVSLTDDEYEARVKDAGARAPVQVQPLDEAFKAMGFDPSGLGEEKKERKARKRTNGELAKSGLRAAKSDPSPYAHPVSSGRRLAYVVVAVVVLVRGVCGASANSSLGLGAPGWGRA